MFKITTLDATQESLTSRTFTQTMTTKFPTITDIKKWGESLGSSSYNFCLSYVELSEEE